MHKILILSFLTILNFSACAQNGKSDKNSAGQTEATNSNMNTNLLTNPIVKQAFQAWQDGDKNTFLSFFTSDAQLTDDGNPRNFKSFVDHACGHEMFTSIDKVENDGKDIYGQFHTESWGDFKTYFKFHLDYNGKIFRLDIGQANY